MPLLLALAVTAVTCFTHIPPASASEPHVPVTLVNCPPFHLEVISGLIHTFQQQFKKNHAVAYFNDRWLQLDAALDMWEAGSGLPLRRNNAVRRIVSSTDSKQAL